MINLNVVIEPEDESISVVYDDAFTVSITKADDNLYTYSNLLKIEDEAERRYLRKTLENLLTFYLTL